ncbi:MAG TPA: SH3 domain-containing protein [Rhabdaerophilum sp.]|nr:SH3 domain-containing protein [Rhabdaerophilum sp.]
MRELAIPIVRLGFVLVAMTGGMVFANAQTRCRIMDPTGTPLNIRETPGGRVVGQLPNGMLVNRAETVRDGRGRAWVFLHSRETGDPIGWVYREFVACF